MVLSRLCLGYTVFGVLGKDSPVGKAILVTSSHKRDGNEINHKITQQFPGINTS